MNAGTISYSRIRYMLAFSLIEVVIALGVFSFALVAVMGLLGLGLTTTKQSSDQIQAANLASLLLATRRASPTNALSNFPIPTVAEPGSNAVPLLVSINGTTLTNGVPSSDVYRLNYSISQGATAQLAIVHLILWWPASLISPPSNDPSAVYEVTTQIVHP